MGRSTVLRVAGLLMATAAIAFAFWLRGGSPTNPTEQAVLDEAIRCFQANDNAGSEQVENHQSRRLSVQPVGRSACREPVPVNGRVSRAAQVSPTIYRDWAGFTQFCMLFVPRARWKAFAPRPRRVHLPPPVAAHRPGRKNGLLYTLVVKGEPGSYEAYLNLAVEPVA